MTTASARALAATSASEELEARFGELVERHLESARRVAWRMLGGGDPAAAEDVTQDALVRAYAALGSFRGESKLETWFYRILVRQAQNHRRWRALRQYWSADAQAEPATSSQAGDPFVRARIEKAMQSLSAPQRECFVLVRLEGFSVNEAAAILGRRPGTLKTHLKRASDRLREELRDLR